MGFGGPDRLAARETRNTAPGRGEVAVRVMAAAVNPVDRKLYADPDYTQLLHHQRGHDLFGGHAVTPVQGR